jgi:lysophospholipase L1-like esterase
VAAARLTLSLLLWLALAAAAAGEGLRCGPFTAEDLPPPVPRSNAHALARAESITQAVKATPHTALFFGDSIVEYWDRDAWREKLAPRGVLNAGVSGDRTDHLRWRLANGDLAGPKPGRVIVLIGTNDLGYGRSPAEAADGVRDILLTLRRRLPDTRILLLALLPRAGSPQAPLRLAVGELNRLIASCADGNTIVYADIGGGLLDRDGRLGAAMSPDRLHFTASGYALLTAHLVTSLDQMRASGLGVAK